MKTKGIIKRFSSDKSQDIYKDLSLFINSKLLLVLITVQKHIEQAFYLMILR